MSIYGNSIAITRYKVQNSNTLFDADINLETAQKNLTRFPFHSIMEDASESMTGWVHFNDSETATFDNPGLLWVGNYLLFSLRRDMRVIPPMILSSEVKKESDAFLALYPNLRRVPKNVREDIKDNVKLKLLSRQLPDTQFWQIIWDIENQLVYLFNTSSKAMEVFEKMFKLTFSDFSLRYLTPWHQAEDIAPKFRVEYDLKEKNLANSEAVLDLIKSNYWLGRDFLLWLLSGQGQCACEGISAWIDCKIDLAGLSSEGGIEKISVTGSQNEMPAIKAALKSGSYITKAGIFVEDNDGYKYSMVLAGETFAMAQFRTPSIMLESNSDQDPIEEYQAMFFEKMQLIQKGLSYFQALFGTFLTSRVTHKWDYDRRQIADWMEE